MEQITVTMSKENGDTVERVIDISNVMVWNGECNQIADVDTQNAMIKEWIADRAEAQHECKLSLVSWFIS